MTRREELKTFLETIIGACTLSINDQGFIVKGNSSLVSNCNYTPTSFSNIKKIFDVIFLEAYPQSRRGIHIKEFDKNGTINNAEKYLKNRGINIPSYYSGKERTKKIHDIIVNSFLKP